MQCSCGATGGGNGAHRGCGRVETQHPEPMAEPGAGLAALQFLRGGSGAEPWGGRLSAFPRVHSSVLQYLLDFHTHISPARVACCRSASLCAQGNGRGIFPPSPICFLKGEILLQMSNTQRLLSSDLEVVVSGFPGGWCRWGKKRLL